MLSGRLFLLLLVLVGCANGQLNSSAIIINTTTLMATTTALLTTSIRQVDRRSLVTVDDDDECAKRARCQRLPDALIIGAKKAGTRAVLEFIRLHPDVRAVGKEVHFFDRDYDKGVEFYRSSMPLARRNHLVVEKTPAYFTDRYAASRIKATLGSTVKLILIVRNPVDRLLSDYAQSLYKAKQLQKRANNGALMPSPIKSFSELAFIRQKIGQNRRVVVNKNYSSLSVGLYSDHLARFLMAGFSLHRNIHIVNGDELPRNPGPEMVRLQQFLKLSPMIDESSFYFDYMKGFSCVKDPLILRNQTFTSTLKAKHRRRRCLGPSKGGRQREHPRLSSEEREALIRFYAPYNAKFFRMVGKIFSSWNCFPDNGTACVKL